MPVPIIVSTIDQLKVAVQRLFFEDLATFRAWFTEFDAQEWDRMLEADAAAGRLDWLVAEALADRQAGRSTER